MRLFLRNMQMMLYEMEPLACLVVNIKRLVRKTHRRELQDIVHYVVSQKNKSALAVYWDIFVKCLASSGLYSDYELFRLHEKTIRQASRYCTYVRQMRFLNQLKTREAETIFREKPQFNKTFQQFLKRDTFYVTEDTTVEELEEFTCRHAVFVAKPPSSNAGYGIWFVDSGAYPNTGDLLTLLKKKGTILLEERVHNHQDINEFSKTSLNTLRIITLRLPEGLKILAAFLRFSVTGATVDNLAQGGFACPIDTETGMIIKGMTRMDISTNFIEMHPDGFYMPGKKIPYWEQVVAMAKEATLFMDDVYFGAWDIAVTAEGPLIIEGNNSPGFGFQRMIDKPANYDMKRAYQFAKKNKRLKRKLKDHC